MVPIRSNPIVDAFILCGYTVSDLQQGFKWESDKLLAQIEQLEKVENCNICNIRITFGWISHAINYHCDGRKIRPNQLKLYRKIRGHVCYVCNITYANEEEKKKHISMHLDPSMVNLVGVLPMPAQMKELGQTSLQQAIRLKDFLHVNFYNLRDLHLYMMIPSWLKGDTIQEKLRGLDKPTYIPITLGADPHDYFTPYIRKHYDLYSSVLYVPSFDESFDGVRSLSRMTGKLMIRALAAIKQDPAVMKNIRFRLYKDIKIFKTKYLIHVTDDDIREVMKDVLINHRTIICTNDLFGDYGCVDAACTSFVHFGVNFKLEREASERLEDYSSLYCYYESRFELGKFELVANPAPQRWEEFAKEVIHVKSIELMFPAPFFTYVALCTPIVDTTEVLSIKNIAEFTDKSKFSVYVGYSFLRGVPPHHHAILRECTNVMDDMQKKKDDSIKGVRAKVGAQTILPTTQLTKAVCSGNKMLYLLRDYLEDSYERAVTLEAAFQLYAVYAKDMGIDNHVDIINKVLERTALAFLTVFEIEIIMRLINEKICLFYDSMEHFLKVHNGVTPDEMNWGILKGPIFLNEAQLLPL